MWRMKNWHWLSAYWLLWHLFHQMTLSVRLIHLQITVEMVTGKTSTTCSITSRTTIAVVLDIMHREDAQRSTLRLGTCSIVQIMSYWEPIMRLKDSTAISNRMLPLAIHHSGNSSILWNKKKNLFKLVSFKIKEDTHHRLNEADMQIIMREF